MVTGEGLAPSVCRHVDASMWIVTRDSTVTWVLKTLPTYYCHLKAIEAELLEGKYSSDSGLVVLAQPSTLLTVLG
jgi:hypothetical protein